MYFQRIIDKELERKLEASGAVLVRGPKACGKTESANQKARSVLKVDQDTQVPALISIDPGRLLVGDTPRLIDEWQVQPILWDYIRHEVDRRRKVGQFILTGSAHPEEDARMHSGAGRFTIVDMRTMSWQELGFSTGKVSLAELFENKAIDTVDQGTDLEFIIEKLIIGGFPTLLGKSVDAAIDVNRAYIALVAEVDLSRVSGVRRDPVKVKSLLRSLARNTATEAEIKSLESDIQQKEKNLVSRTSIYDYIDALQRMMVIENLPAWDAHLRSSASLRKSPKHHYTDVSLAVAALGATKKSLLADINFSGFLFESLVIHELRVYAQANDAKVFHYRDSTGLEIDAIVQKASGEWIAVEIKLGTGQFEEAASNLKKLESKIDGKRTALPQALCIITGTGISYTRKDGIHVVSIASLGV